MIFVSTSSPDKYASCEEKCVDFWNVLLFRALFVANQPLSCVIFVYNIHIQFHCDTIIPTMILVASRIHFLMKIEAGLGGYLFWYT